MTVLYDAPGQVCRITVTESSATRYLELDGCEEGAMDLHSEEPVFHYLWFHKCSHLIGRRPRRAVVLGAGAFSAAKCLALDYPEMPVDTVDAEKELEHVARTFFRLDRPEFARIHFHAHFAEAYLAAQPEPCDFLFDDLFDGFQHVPESSRAREHFRQVRRVLAEGGIYVKNLIWNPLHAATRASCEEAAASLAATFPCHAVYAIGDAKAGHNRMLLGWAEDRPLEGIELCSRLLSVGVPEAVIHDIHLLRRTF